MAVSNSKPRDPASNEAAGTRCGSAEAAVVRWALAHIQPRQTTLPAVVRDDAVEDQDQR